MNVAVIGSNGAIGRRYCAVLRHIGIDPIEIDINTTTTIKQAAGMTDMAINCTTTESHFQINLDLIRYGFRILCEKPCCLSHIEIHKLKKLDASITEVNNWVYTIPSKSITPGNHTIIYDYFNSGKEDIRYNLWQPIMLSKGLPLIGTKSPFLRCYIDDTPVTQREFDMSYIYMIQDFIYGGNAGWDLDTCIRSVEKNNLWSMSYDNNK